MTLTYTALELELIAEMEKNYGRRSIQYVWAKNVNREAAYKRAAAAKKGGK